MQADHGAGPCPTGWPGPSLGPAEPGAAVRLDEATPLVAVDVGLDDDDVIDDCRGYYLGHGGTYGAT